MYDITLLTQQKYHQPEIDNIYVQNILDERALLQNALEAKGLKVDCTYWDNPDYDWSQTKAVVFRTIWDYFERYDAFSAWLEKVEHKTVFINPLSLIRWNIDKHYLTDLASKGIAIVPTAFVDTGAYTSIAEVCEERDWTDVVIKPAIAGGAFHTYKVTSREREQHEKLFEDLVAERDMLIQPFIKSIVSKGEASLMVFNGKYSHAVLKKAKAGDYRIQDDWGGTVHDYVPTRDEISFAEKCFAACHPMPAYGRADILWDQEGNIILGELEIIEPELWVRNYPKSAEQFASGILQCIKA